MKYISSMILFGLFFSYTITGQYRPPEKKQQERLKTISQILEKQHIEKRKRALQWANANNIPVRVEFDDGRVKELQYLDEWSLPVYYMTRNAGAAFTTSTNELHPGGSLRKFITGRNMVAGVWDAGHVDPNHIEIAGRVELKDWAVLNNHATHVGGTIAAKGIAPAAKGMAPDAEILSYDWTSDLFEMSNEAIKGLLISNHSYGIVLGWGWDDNRWRWYAHRDSTTDFRFGYYSSKSQAIDEISFNAPHYLIVWAAGNDRNDLGDGTRPPDGPYDCLGPEGVAKNILTVGAVFKLFQPYTLPEQVIVSDFSSWGPSDDGRIKPDLVGAGVNILSTVTNQGYAHYSGTSMAAPNITGSLLLLQQYFREVSQRDNYMRAATLKGLGIHTASEAGISPGPDYQFGWGLLNTEKAARMIAFHDTTNFFINELTLEQNTVYEMFFSADGSGDVVATISWTDPAGSPVPPALSKSRLMLVNDLDIRIFNEAGDIVYMPWLLSPGTPDSPATRGDNFRDNVEKINIINPPAGRYRLTVSHKGTLLGGRQNFSLLLQTRNIPARTTLFWIGNDGSWSDPTKWALTSGGVPAGRIPTINDHVVFDNNSFVGAVGQVFTVNLVEKAYCYTFNWHSDRNANIVSDNLQLDVFSSMYVRTQNKLQAGPIQVHLIGNLPSNTVYIGGEAFSEAKFTFRGTGSWKITDTLKVKSLEIVDGNFDASRTRINTNKLLVRQGHNKTVDIRHSIIKNVEIFDIISDETIFLAEYSDIFFRTDNPGQAAFILNGNDRKFWNINHKKHEISVSGQNAFNRFIGGGTLGFSGSNIFDSLQLLTGAKVILNANSVQNISGEFIIRSSSDSIVSISSSGIGNAIIEVRDYRKLCFDFLNINNISARGKAIFNAGLNSIVSPLSTGWYSMNCNDVLFADFEYKYACRNSLTHFYDRSTGQIENWLWEFERGVNIETSALRNPITTFTQPGIYKVHLTVSNRSSSRKKSYDLVVMESTLNTGGIIESGNAYFSISMAPFYQWFLNRVPIPGANARSFVNIDNLPGSLQVLLSDGVCNVLSDSIVINVQTPPVEVGERGISIFPNPARSFVNIDLGSEFRNLGRTEIKIYDLRSRLVISKFLEPNGEIFQINTGTLKKGLYLISIKTQLFTLTEKLIIQ